MHTTCEVATASDKSWTRSAGWMLYIAAAGGDHRAAPIDVRDLSVGHDQWNARLLASFDRCTRHRPFRHQRKTDTSRFAEATTRSYISITDKGRDRFSGFERLATKQDQAVDVMFDENGDVWFAGIPARDDFRRLQELLESTGSTLGTSEDKRVPSAQARSA